MPQTLNRLPPPVSRLPSPVSRALPRSGRDDRPPPPHDRGQAPERGAPCAVGRAPAWLGHPQGLTRLGRPGLATHGPSGPSTVGRIPPCQPVSDPSGTGSPDSHGGIAPAFHPPSPPGPRFPHAPLFARAGPSVGWIARSAGGTTSIIEHARLPGSPEKCAQASPRPGGTAAEWRIPKEAMATQGIKNGREAPGTEQPGHRTDRTFLLEAKGLPALSAGKSHIRPPGGGWRKSCPSFIWHSYWAR